MSLYFQDMFKGSEEEADDIIVKSEKYETSIVPSTWFAIVGELLR